MMRHDEPRANLFARSIASAAVMFPGTPRAGSRPLIGRNSTSNASGPSNRCAALECHGIATVVDPEGRPTRRRTPDKDDAPEVRVEPFVGRRHGANPESGALERLSRDEPGNPSPPAARGPEHARDCFGNDQPARPMCRAKQATSQGRNGPSACGWRARHRLPVVESRQAAHRVMRTCGRLVASYFLVRCSER